MHEDRVIPPLVRAPEDPISVEMKMADGVFVKTMSIQRSGTFIAQHAHTYDHTSVVAKGSVAVWENGRWMGVHHAPKALLIKAHIKHTFQSCEDDTLVLCIHRIDRTGEVDIEEEHSLGV